MYSKLILLGSRANVSARCIQTIMANRLIFVRFRPKIDGHDGGFQTTDRTQKSYPSYLHHHLRIERGHLFGRSAIAGYYGRIVFVNLQLVRGNNSLFFERI